MKASNIEKDIIFEDNQIIVCNKEEGVLSQADSTSDLDMLTLLKDYLKVKYNKPGNVYLGLVHRLDKRVSGVMVFGKTSKASSRLSSDIRDKNFEKIYLAIVLGKVTKGDRIVTNIKKEGLIAKVDDNGKESILEYEPLDYLTINNKEFTLLKVRLETGRFNQIRMQLASINHPIINDFKYGYKDNKSNDFVPLGLYCVKLSFNHPVTKERLSFFMNKSLFKYNEYVDLERIYETI